MQETAGTAEDAAPIPSMLFEGRDGKDKEEKDGAERKYFEPPTYTMKEIHDAIPAYCFERNTTLSFLYVIRDLSFILALVLLSTQIYRLPIYSLRVAAWAFYTFAQGLCFTGAWELAHECGHGALSPSRRVNNAIGLVLHSMLLVPYHSWRFTHSQHHKATNNIEKDIAFVPDVNKISLPSPSSSLKSNC